MPILFARIYQEVQDVGKCLGRICTAFLLSTVLAADARMHAAMPMTVGVCNYADRLPNISMLKGMLLQVAMSGNDVSSDYPVTSQTRGLTHNASTGKHKMVPAFLFNAA